jgi:hypothetical protein
MSLYIVLDPLITNQHYKAHAVFFMAAMAFSTTLINGTTARYVLEGLGMVKMTPQQLEVLEYVLKVCTQCLFGTAFLHTATLQRDVLVLCMLHGRAQHRTASKAGLPTIM